MPRTHCPEDYQYYPSLLIFGKGFNSSTRSALKNTKISSIEDHSGWDFQPTRPLLKHTSVLVIGNFSIE
jgi:hypothetical protein